MKCTKKWLKFWKPWCVAYFVQFCADWFSICSFYGVYPHLRCRISSPQLGATYWHRAGEKMVSQIYLRCQIYEDLLEVFFCFTLHLWFAIGFVGENMISSANAPDMKVLSNCCVDSTSTWWWNSKKLIFILNLDERETFLATNMTKPLLSLQTSAKYSTYMLY